MSEPWEGTFERAWELGNFTLPSLSKLANKNDVRLGYSLGWHDGSQHARGPSDAERRVVEAARKYVRKRDRNGPLNKSFYTEDDYNVTKAALDELREALKAERAGTATANSRTKPTPNERT